ncbi:MAG: DUF4294 domain-containing protein [Bacteroidetes bacterium]|nr:DUF4294 domain-containing protein [Bacteroidota bacterium]
MKRILLLFGFLSFFFHAKAQEQQMYVLPATKVAGDTIPMVQLEEVVVYPPLAFNSAREAKRFDRLTRNVKRVYPYAKMAGVKFRELEAVWLSASSEKEKRQIMRKVEDELKAQYGNELEKLSFNQGKILLKLVDRETGNSSFEIVKELRGAFAAFFWQTFASIFGYDLKVRYDPQGEDMQIEYIVKGIENGTL